PVTITNNAPAQFPIGTNLVIWTATDRSGNSSVCTQSVRVTNQPPIISCPTNFALIAPTGQCSVPLNFTVTAIDTCDPSPTITCNPPSGASFPVGRTTVTCIARNAGGSTAICTFTVSVYPTTPAPPIQWQQSFGGTNEDSLQSLQQTFDGGYILGGHSASPPSGNKTSTLFGSYDFWLIRLDPTGNKLWEQTFGGTGYNSLSRV